MYAHGGRLVGWVRRRIVHETSLCSVSLAGVLLARMLRFRVNLTIVVSARGCVPVVAGYIRNMLRITKLAFKTHIRRKGH